MRKQATTFTLDGNDMDLVKKIAVECGDNRSAAVRLALREAAQRRGLVLTENGGPTAQTIGNPLPTRSGITPVYHMGGKGAQPCGN